jgi:hypothetical protein
MSSGIEDTIRPGYIMGILLNQKTDLLINKTKCFFEILCNIHNSSVPIMNTLRSRLMTRRIKNMSESTEAHKKISALLKRYINDPSSLNNMKQLPNL